MPILDAEQLVSVCGEDRDFEALIIGEFRNVTVSAIEELQQAIVACDSERTKAWTHAIKGSSATLGGCALARTCQQLETLAAAEPDWVVAKALLAEIRSGYGLLKQALDARGAAA